MGTQDGLEARRHSVFMANSEEPLSFYGSTFHYSGQNCQSSRFAFYEDSGLRNTGAAAQSAYLSFGTFVQAPIAAVAHQRPSRIALRKIGKQEYPAGNQQVFMNRSEKQ